MEDCKKEIKFNITNKVKRLIGDIVNNAYGIANITNERYKERKEHYENEHNSSKINVAIYNYIIVEFTNGKKVKIFVSEFGEIGEM